MSGKTVLEKMLSRNMGHQLYVHVKYVELVGGLEVFLFCVNAILYI